MKPYIIRTVVQSVALDRWWARITFTCGHTTTITRATLRKFGDGPYLCPKCARGIAPIAEPFGAFVS